MTIEKSIVIIGEISSGKSTIAKRLCADLKIPKASFGSYLLHYCESNKIPDDKRANLQDLGQEMINANALSFLKEVINYSASNQPIILFEGVRHQIILKEISMMSNVIASIYIDATYDQRLQRYLTREKEIDINKTEADFIKASRHPVEREVPLLKSKCSYIVQSSEIEDEDYKKIFDFVSSFLKKRSN